MLGSSSSILLFLTNGMVCSYSMSAVLAFSISLVESDKLVGLLGSG